MRPNPSLKLTRYGMQLSSNVRHYSMLHPQLGNLATDENEPDSLKGNLAFGGRNIPLSISPDDKSLDQAIALAVEIVMSLEEYDRLSKETIVKDLLETYNSGWNEYDEVQEDGSITAVVNPKLTPDEFKNKMNLVGLSICGDCCVDLWYEDEGLFWGHSVFVGSLEGTNFASAQAQIFG